MLEAIRYQRGSLSILDQLQLPYTEHYDTIINSDDAWHAIKEMRTRGAPAIAIVACLALAVEVEAWRQSGNLPAEGRAVTIFVLEKLDYLVTSRPTAVNLRDAAEKLKRVVDAHGNGSGEEVAQAYLAAAERMLVNDIADNQAIGDNGAEWIVKNSRHGEGGLVSVLTHCNTGSLATAGYGTALGIIRSLHTRGHLKQAFCTETRPYNQGARLTAYELVHDKIPASLITDSMAAALLRLRGSKDKIAAIVVGADRVARNGDTANKIGTYSLAILARHHGVKFVVAAPRTTIDLHTFSGSEIVIEERAPHELATVRGPCVNQGQLDLNEVRTVQIAAKGIDIWNPAFDVTPAELIDAIATEVGVAEKGPDGKFDMAKLFSK